MEDGVLVVREGITDSVVVSEPALVCAFVTGTVFGLLVFLALWHPSRICALPHCPRAISRHGSGGWSGFLLGAFCGSLVALCSFIAPIVFAIDSSATSVPLLLVRILQAIVLDNGYVDFIEGGAVGAFPTVYLFCIGMLYVALPVLAALNIYDLVMQNLSSLRVWWVVSVSARKKSVFLFSDFNANSCSLAVDVLKNDDDSIVVFGSMSKAERDTWGTEIQRLGAARAHFLEIDYTAIAVLMCRKMRFGSLHCFAMSDDATRNISETCDTIDALRGRRPDEATYACETFIEDGDKSKRVHLYVTYDSADDELVLNAANRECPDGEKVGPRLQLTALREETMAAYSLLYDAPLHEVLGPFDEGVGELRPRPEYGAVLDVLIVGTGSFAEEVLKAVLWCGQMRNVRLKVRVSGSDALSMGERVHARCPGFKDFDLFDLDFVPVEPQSTKLGSEILDSYTDSASLYVVVAIEDDAVSHEVAMRVRRHFLDRDVRYSAHVETHPRVACLVRDDAMARLVGSKFNTDLPEYGLITFGSRARLFSYANIIDSPLEAKGQIADGLYTPISKAYGGYDFGGEDIGFADLKGAIAGALRGASGVGAESEPISCLEHALHYSNLAVVLHAKYKAWALGYASMADLNAKPPFELDGTVIADLGMCEHDRWTVFNLTQGYTHLGHEDRVCYSREITGRNCLRKIDSLKRHTLVCPNEDIWPNYLNAMSGFPYKKNAANVLDGEAKVTIRVVQYPDIEYPKDAEIQLLDERYGVISSWASTESCHVVEGLPDGRYFLHPTAACAGHSCADDVGFELRNGMLVGGEREVGIDLRGGKLVNPVAYDRIFAVISPSLLVDYAESAR